MSTSEIIKAWSDPEYRDTLTDDQKEFLPDHPAGTIGELSDMDMNAMTNRTDTPCTCLNSANSCQCCL